MSPTKYAARAAEATALAAGGATISVGGNLKASTPVGWPRSGSNCPLGRRRHPRHSQWLSHRRQLSLEENGFTSFAGGRGGRGGRSLSEVGESCGALLNNLVLTSPSSCGGLV